MSIRIHELAKKIGFDNKQMLALLKERKFDVKSVSSTIDNISAEAIVEEFAGAKKTEEPASPEVGEASPPKVEAPVKGSPPKVNMPSGVFVKSMDDIAREKAEKEEQKKAAAEKPAIVAAAPVIAAATPAAVVSPKASPPPLPPAPKSPAPVSVPAPISPPPPPAAKSPASVPPPLPRASTSAPMAPPPLPGSSPTPPPVAVTPATEEAPSDEIKSIQIKLPIIVRDFAVALGMKPFKLISELNQAGGFASMNSTIEEETAIAVAEKHGVILEVKHKGETPPTPKKSGKVAAEKEANEDDEKNLEPRPPVICILGHVDHGKTSLLDAIRKTNVVKGEAGGITQHIGAYQIDHEGRKLTFLDTPGHAAFTKMRARGANVTDIAILVVAADDGFMPQTDEALKHVQKAEVALIVAINKIDTKGANIDQVKTQLQQREVTPEDWGGETITVPVSAIKGEGLDKLIEMILLQADVLELKANPKAEASGIIVESEIDFGRGPLATVIVQRGTLKVGDSIVSGPYHAKVRAMFDDQGNNLKVAPPSTPVRVIGWSGAPESGASFKAVKNARAAEKMAEEESLLIKQAATRVASEPKEVSVERLFANIAATQVNSLKVIIKTDVYGSSEAVRNLLEGIKSDKVSLEIVANSVGLVTKNDILMAGTSNAMVIGFHTKLEPGVTQLAKHHGVRIETFDIIYELADKVRTTMVDMLDPDLKEVKRGVAEIRQVFAQGKGFVAGCLVTEGKITRNASARVRRKKEVLHEGKVSTLKRFKDDANEIRAGLECGIKLDEFNGYKEGDIIEVFEIQKVRASL